ncbi:hypothetical protein JCM6882_002381 [Rhodosporidiobolus microsporus]
MHPSLRLARHALSSTARRSPAVVPRAGLSTSAPRPAVASPATDANEEGGSIADVFSSLSGDAFVPLEQRFSDLKKSIWHDGLIESWRTVLARLEERTEEIKAKGNAVIPQISYSDIRSSSLSASVKAEIKRVGTVVVHGGVPQEEALQWKKDLVAYAKSDENRAMLRGFPNEDPMVYEIYNSVSQTRARSHPALMDTQRFLLSFFHTSDPNTPVSVTNPVSYYDRLRIRPPGDAVFALGPHIDGGSLERWEDPAFRSCWRGILAGGPDPLAQQDSWDLTPRLDANTDLYGNGNGQCSVFRMFQGWTALSETSPNEGTLQVFPDLDLATAYVVLRPFFRARPGREGKLGFNDWEVDLDSTVFPGSVKGKGQELNDVTHPHLRLSETMTSVPKVVPGSQVYWHCDTIHAVESIHNGQTDSSVFYVPAAPLTARNAQYLLDQRTRFEAGRPPADFPQGMGETKFVGRGSERDILSEEGRRAIGYARFKAREGETAGGRRVIEQANKILFG